MFSPDGRRLAGGGTCGKQVHVAVWDLASGKLLHRWDWPTGRDPHSSVESLCFTPGRESIGRRGLPAVGGLRLGPEGRPADCTLWHIRQIYGLSFSPDGQTLVTAGWDSIIRFWETDTGKHESRDQSRRARQER